MAERVNGSDEPRERVPRKFPYYPLEFAIQLAERVYEEGGGRVDKSQIAEILGLKPRSSSLEMRIITAAMFGVVARRDKMITLTPLGRKVAKPASEEERATALAEAFLNVPLFAALKDSFAGRPLPSETGLKVLLAREWGVPEAHKNDAYNILVRSAKQAGILVTRASGQYLSTIPAKIAKVTTVTEEENERSTGFVSNAELMATSNESPMRSNPVEGLHPSIKGLVDEMARDARTWDADKRRTWQSALMAVLDYVYPDSKGGS